MNNDALLEALITGRITVAEFAAAKEAQLAQGRCMGCNLPCKNVEGNPANTEEACPCCY